MLQHPVPDKLLVHIGDITVSFALLELMIQQLAGTLITDRQNISQIITAELAFKNLRALTISLYKERYSKNADFDILKKLMKRAAYIEDKRNQITHSFWCVGNKQNTIMRAKKTAKEKHGFRFYFEEFSEQDLAEIAVEIKQLAKDIQNFWLHLLDPSITIAFHGNT